jgi:TPR repeat protein
MEEIMRFKQALFGLSLLLLLGNGLATAAPLEDGIEPAPSSDVDKGFEAYELGNYKAALAEWTALAEQGIAQAQYSLGYMYDNGEGVPENDTMSLRWYTQAAEQGHAKAQTNLGVMYEYGIGVLTNSKRAYMWYNIGNANGNKLGGTNKGKITKKMTLADISKSQDMSLRCLESNYTDC